MVNLATTGSASSFETERLYIRRYVLADTPRLYEAARESITEVFPFLPWCHPDYSIEDSRSWVRLVESEWDRGSTFSFAIYDRDRQTFHGGCGLSRIDEHPVANLGYWIRTGSTGQGIATEATLGLARFAFRYLGLARLEIIMSTRNERSRGVAVKAGASYEGKLANRLRLHDEMHDAWLYSLTPDSQRATMRQINETGENR